MHVFLSYATVRLEIPWEVPSTTVLAVSPFDYDSTGSWETDLQETVITKQLFLGEERAWYLGRQRSGLGHGSLVAVLVLQLAAWGLCGEPAIPWPQWFHLQIGTAWNDKSESIHHHAERCSRNDSFLPAASIFHL